ncbi:MAG: glycosyltransferase [Planctomycetes bacterium]|nr:glycosyltransferase [Planctomycetota bacterium]
MGGLLPETGRPMLRRIRVRHVITTLDVGGAENHLLRLVSGFDPARFETRIAYLKGAGTLADAFRAAGAGVDYWPLAGPVDPVRLVQMAWRLAAERPDVVHTHLFKGDFHGGIAAWLAGVPAIISTKHNEDPELLHPVFGPLGRLVLALDGAVVAISRSVARHVLATSLPDRRKIRVIHYGIDPPGPEARPNGAFRREMDLAEGTPLVVLVGRLEPQKDIGTFLDAAARVRALRPDVRFAIVGRGAEEGRLRERARELGLEEAVRFAGFRPDAAAILGEADAVALTSRWEGFGLVLVEAMSRRRPVVATAVGPVPEVVGDAALLAPPGDPAAVADRLLAVLSDKRLAARLGQAGEARVRERFSADRMIAETVRLYVELLSKKGKRW